jgi:hypothetical protein
MEFNEEETRLIRRVFEVHQFQRMENAKTAKSILVKMGVENPAVYTSEEGFCVTDAKSSYLADLRDIGVDVQEVE